jgi:hypothetical protein
VVLFCPERSRDKVREALSHAGAGFDGESSIVAQRKLDPPGHLALLRPVFVPSEDMTQRAVWSEVGFGRDHPQVRQDDGD